MQMIPVNDETFAHLPEIKEYCPCPLHVYSCEGADGMRFQIGRLTDMKTNSLIYIYPVGNEIARKTILAIGGQK